MYANPEWILPYCGGMKDGESRWQSLRTEHPLRSGRDPIHVTVRAPSVVGSIQPVIGSVLISDVFRPENINVDIQLQMGMPDKHDPWYPCWMGLAP
jgi:hypothetical protein